MNQTEIDKLADQIREIYKTNEGPKLLHDMMQEFPYPRRVWNDNPDALRGVKGGWGMLATSTATA